MLNFYFQIFISKIYNSYIIICFWKKLKFERVFYWTSTRLVSYGL